MTHRRHQLRPVSTTAVLSLVGVALTLLLSARPSGANTLKENAFNHRPRARAAMILAHTYLRQGRSAKAVNWANRAASCRDATASIRGEASRMERRLQWKLHDLGFGVVEIRIMPAGADLRIDGQLFRPARAVVRMWLPSGSHQLEVGRARYHTIRKIITAKAGEHRRLTINLVNAVLPVVRFHVRPVNAEVWLAQDFMGFSAARRFTLPVGKSLIELRAPGYVSWVRTLDLHAGQIRTIKVVLEKSFIRDHHRTTAANVRRRLTPLELSNRGERHRLGKRPGSNRARRRTYRGSGEAPTMATSDRPNWRKVARADNSSPDMQTPMAPEDLGGSGGDDGGGGDDAFGGTVDGSISTQTLSTVSKGWVYTGIGVALVAGGVGSALYGTVQAGEANNLAPGNKRYDSYYDNAANLTYAGYGSAGIGVVSLVMGGLYLFSDDGLSERQRGMFLMGTGLVTALAGGWLINSAVATAKLANALPLRSFAYERNFDGAQANWRAGIGAAGVGSAVVALGAWLWLTAEADDAAQADLDGSALRGRSWLARTSILPSFGDGRVGGNILLRF